MTNSIVMDRRALLIGNWQSDNESITHQRVRSLMERWAGILSSGDPYLFHSVTTREKGPDCLENPTVSKITEILHDQATDITDATELLFYYVGHSVGFGEHDIMLSLNKKEGKQTRRIRLSDILQWIYDSNIRKLVMILDTCHAGRVRPIINQFQGSIFAMCATGDGYAFDASFSARLLRTLEAPLQRGDQRIDRRHGGVTYKKLFQFSTAHLSSSSEGGPYKQRPESFGTLGDTVLLEAPPLVPDGYPPLVSDRTIYGRLFSIIEMLLDGPVSEAEILKRLRSRQSFLTRQGEDGSAEYVSRERISEYLRFMRKAGFIASVGKELRLTGFGRSAASHDVFNKQLLQAIEDRVLPEDISIQGVEQIVKELLDDMVQTTPARISERAQMKGIQFRLDEEVRFAFQVLPTTGRFLKGSSDALFPAG